LEWSIQSYSSRRLAHGNVVDNTLTRTQVGWHYFFPLIRSLVPFAVNPSDHDLMVAVDYGIPLYSSDGGSSWNNLYCTGDDNGWSSRGLNLLCAASTTFLPDGRLVIGALDYGVFVGTSGANSAYLPLNDGIDGTLPGWPAAIDVETIRYAGEDEIYMADNRGYAQYLSATPTIHLESTIWKWNQGLRLWDPITEELNAALGIVDRERSVITDMAFADSNTVFVSVANTDTIWVTQPDGRILPVERRHYFVCKGVRSGSPSDWRWDWSRPFDSEPSYIGDNTKVINRLCLIPGTTKLLFGAKARSYTAGMSPGGLYCADYADESPNWAESLTCWLGGTSSTTGALNRLGRNVTSIAADALGQYVYAGSSGHDRPQDHGRGGLVRFRLVNGEPSDPEILAGRGDGSAVVGDKFGLFDTDNYVFTGANSTAWEFCTRVSDVQIDPRNPKVAYIALGNNAYFDDSFGAWCVTDTTWVHASGGYETGSGAATVDINPVNNSELYIGSRSQEYFVTNITPASAIYPAVGDTAAYPMLAGVTDTSLVFAVRIHAVGGIEEATVNLTGIGLVDTVLILRDDGKGEDVDAGDGIFSSRKFAKSLEVPQPLAPPLHVEVFAEAAQGGYSIEQVLVEVVASTAKFVDVTTSTGDLAAVLTEQPYSAVYFKAVPGDSLSEDIMIVTFDNDGSSGVVRAPQILQQTYTDPVNGAPQFATMTQYWIDGGEFELGARGICYADYDNDGDNDFFICNPSFGGKLYRNDLPTGFSEVTSDVFGADISYLTHAISASWGDYNRDGFVDLYVTGTNYFESVQLLTAQTFASAGGGITSSGWIFKNTGGSGLRKSIWGKSGEYNVYLSSCWADLDDDGDLDQITAKFVLGVIEVLENQGYHYGLGDNLMAYGGWRCPVSDPDYYFGANSVTPIDYDHDEYPDLLVTFATHDGNPKAKILLNNYPEDKEFTPIELAAGTEWNGATVGDFDFNGQEDILLHPRAANTSPVLLMADGYSDQTPTYSDLGYTLGLRGGATGGGVAANFDQARGIDLYLGRGDSTSTKALYHNLGGASSSSSWIEVRLHPNGNSNRTLVGTKVVVESSGKRWQQVVDGGSGRGGQSANQLLFGLGDASNSVNVTVTYASGEIDTLNSMPVNTVVECFENQLPLLKPGIKTDPEPDYDIELEPGTTDWIFRWRTTNNKGDIKMDQVEVQNYYNYDPSGNCGVGIAVGGSRFLNWGDPDTEFLVYWDGTLWQHEVRWMALPCGLNCEYRFRVKSGANGQSTPYSGLRTMTTSTFCVTDPVDPTQP
jgi:hypothetical protein